MRINLKRVPKIPGVYFFRNKRGLILYIGKAANLKSRLGSYSSLSKKGSRIEAMLDQATKVDWQETDSEIEALILESQLIKKHRPPFNVMLRDDKQYFFVGITRSTDSTSSRQAGSGQANDEFPKIFITHQPTKIRNQNIEIRKKSKILNQKVRNISDFGFRASDFIYIGPFTDGDALKTTLRLLRRIFPYCTCKQKHNNYCLNYHIGKCPGFCCLKNPAIKIKDYELSNYKNNIRAINDILNGKRKNLVKKLEKEMKDLSLAERFEDAIALRDKIEKLEKTFQNAKIIHNSKFSTPNYDNTIGHHATLKELVRALNLPGVPARIEGYDISNIQGQFATGAMAVFTAGQPDKSQYRKFKIRLAGGPDDTAMLKEILIRRFNHPEWPYPNLIVVDGGRAQLNVAVKIISGDRKTRDSIPVIALTKNDKHRGNHIYLGASPVHRLETAAILLKKLPELVRNLILQIDAEAHRFAINYYRKLHRRLD